MFLEMRNTCSAGGKKACRDRILAYEKLGTSPRYSYYALPRGCDTVFFPGCALPATRPGITLELFGHLRQTVPSVGIVLDCCTKPSHDLGHFDHFRQMFYEMKRYLVRNGICRIITACPNCHTVFKAYGHGLSVQTAYEYMDEVPPEDLPSLTGKVVIHDPCPMRFDQGVQNAARGLVSKMGLAITPVAHERKHTLCCGEGGSVSPVAKDLSENWRKILKKEIGENPVVTYCAGCANALGKTMPAFHLLDLIFDPFAWIGKKPKKSTSPFTRWNRLGLKRKLIKTFPAEVTRERNFATGIFSYNHLLVADADTTFTEPLAHQLQKMGFSVFQARSGENVMERVVKNVPVDVVLLDAGLPGMDPMEVLRRIKDFDPFIQVIVISARSTVPEAISAMKSGASDYLGKPLDFENILAHIQRAMDE
jgi:CheY-like chemotaxis protein